MGLLRNVALGLIGAAAVASASDVHALGKDTFDAFVNDHSLALIEFYAPWCGHCKALAPEYEEAATTLKEKNIALAKVDCTEETEICQKHGVEGYPTLKVFRGHGSVTPYSGQRKAPALVSYMVKQSLPAVSLLNKDTIEEFKTTDKVVLVGYFKDDDKASSDAFTAAAEKLRDSFLFGTVNDAALAETEGAEIPSIIMYKQFDDGKTLFTDKFSEEAIETFARSASVPLVGEVGPETYSGYIASGIPLAYIFAETPEERASLAEEIKPVAVKHKGKINFATIDAKAFGAHAANLNLETDKFPAFAIQDTFNNQKYPFDQGKQVVFSEIDAFVQSFVDGKMKPSIKSEPVPEKQEGPVHVVVAHNYDQIVKDDTKDVLIEFYAPWCGHCKALAPKYEELAALYFNNPDYAGKVIVAKVDATANDVPDEIQGFPTIKLYPAGAKDKPVDYSGSRTIEDLANFIKENGKYGVDAYVPPKEDAEESAETAGHAAPAATEKEEEASTETKGTASEETGAAKTEDVHDEL
ncbi:MAG: protein disulfide-isomerase precursor [Geoglossum simile]|nr:MAG: protein disulfide-isomerase precursor [Geoglossum simile]